MTVDILLSGFGGQGLMSLGKFLAKAALRENRHTIWIPSYGAEVRGGTAYCFIKISDEPIKSPLVKNPDIAILLNQPSLDRFKATIKKNGLLILNSDLITITSGRDDLKELSFPLNKFALECGNIKVANTVALGILLALKSELIKKNTVNEILSEVFAGKKEILEQNLKAIAKGEEIVKS